MNFINKLQIYILPLLFHVVDFWENIQFEVIQNCNVLSSVSCRPLSTFSCFYFSIIMF